MYLIFTGPKGLVMPIEEIATEAETYFGFEHISILRSFSERDNDDNYYRLCLPKNEIDKAGAEGKLVGETCGIRDGVYVGFRKPDGVADPGRNFICYAEYGDAVTLREMFPDETKIVNIYVSTELSFYHMAARRRWRCGDLENQDIQNICNAVVLESQEFENVRWDYEIPYVVSHKDDDTALGHPDIHVMLERLKRSMEEY